MTTCKPVYDNLRKKSAGTAHYYTLSYLNNYLLWFTAELTVFQKFAINQNMLTVLNLKYCISIFKMVFLDISILGRLVLILKYIYYLV